MSNYADSALELTLLDGSKIDFYPAGMITAQDETYLPSFPQDQRNEVENQLEEYAYNLFKSKLLNNLRIRCYNYDVTIDNTPLLSLPYFSPLPRSKFRYFADTSDLRIPVTRMSKPSSNGEMSASRLGLSGKIVTDSFLVREQRTDIKEARRTLSGIVPNGEETFNNGMDKRKGQLPKITSELVAAGKTHLNLISDFYRASQDRPLWKQMCETPSQRDFRWKRFNHS